MDTGSFAELLRHDSFRWRRCEFRLVFCAPLIRSDGSDGSRSHCGVGAYGIFWSFTKYARSKLRLPCEERSQPEFMLKWHAPKNHQD